MSARIEQVNHVVIYTTDMDNSIEFYHDILGLDLRSQSDHYSEVGASTGPYIGLHIAENVVRPEANGQRTEVSFQVSNIKGTEELLRAKGVKFTRSANEIAPGRWVANFVDPDGNPLSLYEHLDNNMEEEETPSS